ncbi:MAG: OmpA family protein, partial [Pseudomonas stutzeri]|nr:OmpA family protein [Stutzerimonas stutzeri]
MSGTLLLAMAALGGCAQHSYVMLADDSGGRGAAVLGDEQRV